MYADQVGTRTVATMAAGRSARLFGAPPVIHPRSRPSRDRTFDAMSIAETTHSPRPLTTPTSEELQVSVVIPCLNEAENIQECVRRARAALDDNGIPGEVIVADNDSDDGSAELAAAAGARVVSEPRRGYGSAYLAGFGVARGAYIVMADADMTYDWNEIPRFIEHLDAGGEMVIGDRMKNIHPGAMPWLHRYVGNPLLTGFLNVLFGTGVRDAHCGMRAVRR